MKKKIVEKVVELWLWFGALIVVCSMIAWLAAIYWGIIKIYEQLF